MYKKILLLLIFVLISSCSYSEEIYSDGDVIVIMKSSSSEGASKLSLSAAGVDTLRVSSFAENFGARVKHTYPSLSAASKNIFTVFHSDTKKPKDFARELLNNPDVIAASPNYEVYASVVPNDPHSTEDESWGIYYINAPEAWEVSKGSNEIYVAVIDSGIDYTNTDLSDNLSMYYARNFIDTNASAKDDHSSGHGTHVAGIIGAVGNNSKGISGVCWNVKLIPLKVLNKSGRGSEENVIKALDYVVSLIEDGIKVKAVNMSFETSVVMAPIHENLVTDPLWRAFKAVDELNEAVLVVAAGNYGKTVGVADSKGEYVYPASFRGLNNMISVSALDTDGELAVFSSSQASNKEATMSAPGYKILSTVLQDSNTTTPTLAENSGTSMAAPYVSGAAALLASIYSDRTAYQLKNALLRNSADHNDTKLDIKAAIDFQEQHLNDEEVLPSEAGSNSYDDWTKYEAVQRETKSNSGSGGGCNGMMMNIFALIIFVPLAKKSLS